MSKVAEKTVKVPRLKGSRGVSPGGGVLTAEAPAAIPDTFAKVFAALGEPTRLHIMEILPRQPICAQMYNVIELAEELGLTQPTISHHLKILAEAELVLCRRQCNSLYYYVNQSAVLAWLDQTKSRFGC